MTSQPPPYDPEYGEEAADERGLLPDPAAFACPAHDPGFGGDPGLSPGCGACDPVAIVTMAERGASAATPRQDAVRGLLMNRVRQIRAMKPSEYWRSADSPDWEAMMLYAQVADELAPAPNWETTLAGRVVDEPAAAPAREPGGLSI